ncbi:hypothetical protein ACROYT_G022307 [Oculina patagonica]
MAEVCSLFKRGFIYCGPSRGRTEQVLLYECRDDISVHLKSCCLSRSNLKEYEVILQRAGLAGTSLDDVKKMRVCARHRYGLGRKTKTGKSYTEPRLSFCATPETTRTQDPRWTPSVLSGPEEDSEEEKVVPDDHQTVQLYNTAMANLAASVPSSDEFTPLSSRLKTTWGKTAAFDREKCRENALQGCLVICGVVAPNAKEELFHAICQPIQSESENVVSGELLALMTAYRDAPSKSVKLQILSIYAFRFSAEKLMLYHEPFEKITRWQIKQARKHAKEQGPGVPEEKKIHHRVRLPIPKVDHFIDFVNRPYFYQDVAYGTRVLKLDSGEKVTMPNVVRTVTRSTMIHQYLQYCAEESFTPLSRRTLFKILEVREASQRKSLRGLANIATDGAAGFESLEKIVDELQTLGAAQKWCSECKAALKESKCYLKTEYPVHCKNQSSTCPDHCRTFALSDNTDNSFKIECDHAHDTVCNDCEALKGVLQEIEEQVRSGPISFYSDEHKDDVLYDLANAKRSILDWKAHILRSCHQEKAKQDMLQNLDTTEAIVVLDWAMKFQQMKFREKQSDWFGKRGLSWHISSVVFREEKHQELEVQSYAHLFDSCNQDGYAVASIVEDLCVKLKSRNPAISHVYLRSDEAGCYQNNYLVAALASIGKRTGIAVKRLDHSEPQHGKDICDRILCPMKAALRTYCNEGHDILNAKDMQTALKERPVKGTTAAVCTINRAQMNAEVKKIEGFSKFHNFCFERDGVRVWRCYDIGKGKLIPHKSLIVKPQGPTSIITEKPFFDIGQSRVLKPEKKNAKESPSVFVCPEPGCNITFAKFADFELHLVVGEHNLQDAVSSQDSNVGGDMIEDAQSSEESNIGERIMQDAAGSQGSNVYDKLRKDWANRFITIQTENSQLRSCQINSTLPNAKKKGVESQECLGWALPKIRSGATKFSDKVRDYLTAKFDLGEKTGQKEDAEQVAKDMRSARTVDNERMFSREDWLSKTQVQGFFSRLGSKRRKQASKGSSHCEEEDDEDDEEDEAEQEHRQVVEKVMNDLGLKHPIVFDIYNICQYYHDNKLSSFNVNMLREICRHFLIPFKYRDLKKELMAKVADVVKECTCYNE